MLSWKRPARPATRPGRHVTSWRPAAGSPAGAVTGAATSRPGPCSACRRPALSPTSERGSTTLTPFQLRAQRRKGVNRRQKGGQRGPKKGVRLNTLTSQNPIGGLTVWLNRLARRSPPRSSAPRSPMSQMTRLRPSSARGQPGARGSRFWSYVTSSATGCSDCHATGPARAATRRHAALAIAAAADVAGVSAAATSGPSPPSGSRLMLRPPSVTADRGNTMTGGTP